MSEQPSWAISSEDLNVESSLGSRVTFGSWMRANVAVKPLSVSGDHALLAKEVSRRMKLNHPHLLPLYGVCLERKPPLLVYEDAVVGTIAQYFRHGVNMDSFWGLFYQASTGLLYLQSKQMAHGNLKGSSILVGVDGTAKVLCDLSFALNRKAKSRSDPSMDVFALGICLIQAWSGMDPTDEVTEAHAAMPQRPPGMSDQGWRLVETMCQLDPLRRPTLVQVSNELHELMMIEAIERVSHGDRSCGVCNAIGSSADKFCGSCGNDVRAPAPSVQNAVQQFVADPTESVPVNVTRRVHERLELGYSGVYAH